MNRPRGFSAAEVLLSFLLLSVAVLALLGVLTGGLNLFSRSEELSEAAQVARDFFEEVKQLDPLLIPDDTSFDGVTPAVDGFPPAPYPVVTLRSREYRMRVVTQKVSELTVSVVTEISWEGGGRSTFETYIAR